MSISGVGYALCSCVAAATLAACGGSDGNVPPLAATIAAQARYPLAHPASLFFYSRRPLKFSVRQTGYHGRFTMGQDYMQPPMAYADPSGSNLTPNRHSAKNIGLWVTLPETDRLLGLTANGKKTIAEINTAINSCDGPRGIKVDGSQNVWLSCAQNEPSEAQEYSSSGSYTAGYTAECPSGWGNCDDQFWASLGSDVAVNSSYVFLPIGVLDSYKCDPSCTYENGTGFEYWQNGDSTSTPNVIYLNANDPVTNVEYCDLDSSGNLWFTFYGYDYQYQTHGYGLAKIENPTSSSWSLVTVEPIGTYASPAGVYASNRGNTINVVEVENQGVYQYNLSGSQIGVLGPVSSGAPLDGGFDKRDKKMAIGDLNGYVDVGNVARNHWKQVQSSGQSPVAGAAYTPSDK